MKEKLYSKSLEEDMHAAWYQVESISKKPFPHDPRELARDHQIYKDNVQAFLIAWRQWKKSLED